MARLHEHQGKTLLSRHGIGIPRGEVIRSAQDARSAASRLGPKTILKVQAWVTGRKALGGVLLADDADQAVSCANQLLAKRFGDFPVTEVLIEELLPIKDELFVSLSIDDSTRAPVLLLNIAGGSGIEQRAIDVHRFPVDLRDGIDAERVRQLLQASPIDPKLHDSVLSAVLEIVNIGRQYEARSVEINPLVTTRDGRVLAADCRMTIDDYAVFRHPELGIEIAREMDHPPTRLERIAYGVEEADHRGTFYFAQLPVDPNAIGKGLIGFHGAGGGGSMMSMDAVTAVGFTLANFCDTSGNPSAAKVYRAARIILSQPGLVGYFGSGSGVASQEQFWSAYGIAKAFVELNLDVPAVIRLGGNSEDRAVEILTSACKELPARIEGYKKDDSPAKCAERFAALVLAKERTWKPRPRLLPPFVGHSYSFPIQGGAGRVWIDHESSEGVISEFVIQNSSWLLKPDEHGKPVLAVTENEASNKDSEMIMLEMECRRSGWPVVFVDLPVAGID